MVTLREAVEATLRGRDLVTKCDVDGILHVFERWDIYDIELEACYAIQALRMRHPGLRARLNTECRRQWVTGV